MGDKEDNWYEAIGIFVVEFSRLTYTLSLCIKKLVENDPSLLKEITDDLIVKKKIVNKGYKVTNSKIQELPYVLSQLLTTWEICPIFKKIFLVQYGWNLKVLKIIDSLFRDIDEFCAYDWIRNDFMHSLLLIEDKELWNIMINREILLNGKLTTKKIKLNLDEQNKKLKAISVNIFGLSKILHFDKKIENYITLEKWKIKFTISAEKIIKSKTKI
jgi:hypothetical protein